MRLPGRAYPGIRRDDQHAQAALDPPERERLLVAGELGRDRRRDVADLQRPLLVPDRDRVRVVLVRRLGDEREPARRVERRVGQRLRPVGDARRRDDPDARVLPADRLIRGRVAEVEAVPRRARARAAAARSPNRVVAQDRVHAEHLVDDLGDAEVDDDRREARARPPRESPCSRSIRSSIPSTAIRAARAEVLVEAERQPGAVDPGDRPLERRGRRGRRASPPPRPAPRSPCPRPRRRPGRRGRRRRRSSAPSTGIGRYSVVPATSSLQSMLPPQRPRRDRRVDARLVRRHPEHAEERRQADRAARRRGRRRRRAPSRSGAPSPPKVTPHEPGTTSSIRTASTCPARAPRTSIGPASAWPVSSSGFRDANGSSRPTSQPAFGIENRTESPGSTVSTGSSSREKCPCRTDASSGSS